jgi:hypothetical protein
MFSDYLEKMGFDGTVFRLPLRNERMARDSEPSDQAVMLETFALQVPRPDVFDCLLFLNPVRSIQRSEIDESTGEGCSGGVTAYNAVTLLRLVQKLRYTS